MVLKILNIQKLGIDIFQSLAHKKFRLRLYEHIEKDLWEAADDLRANSKQQNMLNQF